MAKRIRIGLPLLCSILICGLCTLVWSATSSDLAWRREKDADRWTDIVTTAVAATGLPKIVPADIAAFCPMYEGASRSDRTHFWAGLVAAVADSESNFNTHAVFKEPMHEHGDNSPLVISQGLLQLSFPGDRDNYQCDLPSAESLYDPAINLRCGVKILAKWVTQHNRIAGQVGTTWQGGAVYWSTLRSKGGHDDSNAKNLAKIEQATQSLMVCQKHH